MTRRNIRGIAAALFGFVLFLGIPTEAYAQAGCFGGLKECFGRAARMRSWVDRTLSGLDCELDFVECARRKILGR